MKKRVILFIALILILITVGCGRETTSTKPQIVVSLYPLQNFAEEIGGSYVNVVNLIPPGTEPHDFEPTPQDMITISKAKLFIYNGAGLENWVNRTLANIDVNKTHVLNTASKIKLHKAMGPEIATGNYDPHIWLDPYLAQKQSTAIYQAMMEVDPKHKQIFTQNYQKLNEKFQQLEAAYSVLAHAPSRVFVTSHAAFGYLADRYHLQQIPITGISPEDEPSPKELKNLVDLLRKDKIKVVFFETLVNNKLASTLQNEIGAKAEVLNPLEGLSAKEMASKADYFSVMMGNLSNLKKALGVNHE